MSEQKWQDPFPMFTPPPCCIQCSQPIADGEECHLTAAAAVHARCLDRYTRGEDPRVRHWLEGRKVVARRGGGDL